MIKKIKKTIDSANINFLIGAGLSAPFLEILGSIEIEITMAQAANDQALVLTKKKEYFEKSMLGNLKIVDEAIDVQKDEVLKNYENFYKRMNHILLNRENSILTKQVNIFTTNIDLFSEKALENTGIEFNDGFHGRFNPRYDAGNFKKSYYKKSLHYENTSEIPVFNILKLHGSLTWRKKDNEIYLDHSLGLVREIQSNLNTPSFEDSYKKLMVVNPSKQKFEDTLLNEYYYDLLRIYSNELEKENCVLFVMGFSFTDEHIQGLTLRVANSNPTLKVYIFCHTSTVSPIFKNLENSAKNKNIEIITPDAPNEFNLKTITSGIFDKIIPFKEEDRVSDTLYITDDSFPTDEEGATEKSDISSVLGVDE